MQNRLKSKVVWLAVLAQILIVLGLFAPGLSDTIKIAGTVLVEILTLFGVLNNPTDSENF